MAVTHIEYRCSYCGMNQMRSVKQGRPMPSQCGNRPKRKDGWRQPHSWVISRKIHD